MIGVRPLVATSPVRMLPLEYLIQLRPGQIPVDPERRMPVPQLERLVALQPGRRILAAYDSRPILNRRMIDIANLVVRDRWRYVDQQETTHNNKCTQ